MENDMIAKKNECVFENRCLVEDVEELSLLLPSWQIMALADAAENEGMTVAQWIRRVVNKALAQAPLSGTSFHSA